METEQASNRRERRLTKAHTRKEKTISFKGAIYGIEEASECAKEMAEAKNIVDAMALYQLVLAKDPDHAASLNNLGLLFFRFGDIEKAIPLFRHAIRNHPYLPYAYHNLGDALASKGEFEEAEKMQLKSLSIKPDSPRALYCLASIKKYASADHPYVQRINELLEMPEGALQDRTHCYFALAKIYDDCGHYDEAFNYYRRANETVNATIAYAPEIVRKDIDDTIDVFSKETLAEPKPFPSPNRQPLFIVGMPRSGTSFLANILSSHRDINSAGELPTVPECTAHIPHLMNTPLTYPLAARNMTPQTAAILIKTIEKYLTKDVLPNVPYIIDKHPINFRHVGMIHTLFPNAKIIHCTRNPVDTCLSNYFQYFDPSYAYSFDLKNTAHFYGQYVKLMAHWRQALPSPMLEINYDDAIHDVEGTVRGILDYLELEWDPRCLEPHKNKHVVKTASMWQVRQPVYKHASERWRNYEKHLGALFDSLKQNGVQVTGA